MLHFLNLIDNRATFFYKKTTSMFSFCKDKLLSLRIPTLTPIQKLRLRFYTWTNPVLLVEENKIIAYY